MTEKFDFQTMIIKQMQKEIAESNGYYKELEAMYENTRKTAKDIAFERDQLKWLLASLRSKGQNTMCDTPPRRNVDKDKDRVMIPDSGSEADDSDDQ